MSLRRWSSQGAPADGRRLGSSQAVAFDEAAAEMILGVRERTTAPTVAPEACATGGVRGRSCSGAAPDNGAPSRAPERALRRGASREEGSAANGECARERPKLAPRRQAWVSRGRVAARRSGATRVVHPPSPEVIGRRGRRGVSPRVKRRALGSRAMTRVLVSNVGCRCWREASSSFHRGPREGAEVGRW